MDQARLQAMAREQGPRFLVEAAVNFLLPLLIYDAMKARSGDVGALLWSSLPPMLWSVVELVRHRRLDAICPCWCSAASRSRSSPISAEVRRRCCSSASGL